MSWSKFFAYVCASLTLAIAPGPDNCFVLAQSAGCGAMAGIWVTLGLISGLSVHITLALLGTATLLKRFPKAISGISFLGALYLLYVAWQMLGAGTITLGEHESLSPLTYYRRGIFLNLSNPKVILFFIAFIPQFVDPHHPHPKRWLGVLGLTFAGCACIVMCGYSLLGGTLAHLLQSSKPFAHTLNILASGAVLLVAIWILIPLFRKNNAKNTQPLPPSP